VNRFKKNEKEGRVIPVPRRSEFIAKLPFTAETKYTEGLIEKWKYRKGYTWQFV
jgi:hypothetical protein